MALPPNFGDSLEYFKACLEFLDEYQWIFKYPNTEILKHDLINCMPDEWRHFFSISSHIDLNNIALGVKPTDAPESLNAFIDRVNELKPNFPTKSGTMVVPKNVKGHSLKKLHEIESLAPLIADYCVKNRVEFVVDIGCGLGYLTNLLNERYNFKVIGIDCNETFLQRAQSLHPKLPFVHLIVDSESGPIIIQSLDENFKGIGEKFNVCLIALHACADLTVDILKMLLKTRNFSISIVMPCCYHRMLDDFDGTIANFPLSSTLSSLHAQMNLSLDRPFLRMACQHSNAHWKDMNSEKHSIHAKNLLFRNLLELVVSQEGNLRVRRLRRKTGSTNQRYDIDEFLENFESCYFVSDEFDREVDGDKYRSLKKRIRGVYGEDYATKECLIEGFSALQNTIQSVCENLVLFDRCVYMDELNVSTKTIKVTNEEISPRSFALVSEKGPPQD